MENFIKFLFFQMADMTLPSKTKNSDWWRRLLQPIKPTYWLLITRENGNLEIYSMPDLKLVYLVTDVGNANKILQDAMEFVPLAHQNPDDPSNDPLSQTLNSNFSNTMNDRIPREILMIGLGHNETRPLLFIRLKNEILIYRVYRYPMGHLKIRFRKMKHDIMYLNVSEMLNIKEEDEYNYEDEYNLNPINVLKLRPFTNVNGHDGVVVCGSRSYFVFLTIKGELRVHQFNDDTSLSCSSSVKSFAPFNNVNCPKGFLYFNVRDDNLKISTLPTNLTVDSIWPMQKIMLRCSPSFIVFHKEVKVYGLVMSQKEINNKFYRFNGEDKELCEDNKGERFLYPLTDKFSFVLVDPKTWEIVPEIQVNLEEWEHVCALKVVMLSYEGARSGLKEYICMGTNYNYSEDITSRGRILLFDLIEVVPEPGKPWTKYKLKEVYAKEQKGPVSAITHSLGFLVTSVGQKVYLWQLKDGDLVGVAFIDTNIFIHQMISIKSLILVADVYKSVSILRFQEEYRTLSLVSRDYNPLMVYQIEYMVDNANLGFLVSDADKNLSIFMYQPESRDSHGGQKLLRKADYHLGQKINAMFRVQTNFRQYFDRRVDQYENKHITYFGKD